MIKRIQYRLKVLHNLFPQAKGVKRFFLYLLIFAATSTALSFATPVFYKIFIDKVILGGIFSEMPIVVIGYLGVFFAGIGLGYAKNWATYTLVNTTLYNTRLKILKNLFAMPFSAYESASIGDMKMRIDDDTNQISDFAGSQTIDYLFSYITMLVSAGILLFIDWRLALFAISAIPLTFWLNHIISKHEKEVNEAGRENAQKMSAWMHASVQGWREVKALNLERHETHRFYRFLHIGMLCNAKWINYWTARQLVVPKIKDEFFMRFGLYFIGGFLIISGKMSISDLLVFAMYYEMLSSAVKTVSSTDADLQSNMPYTDRLMESLAAPENAVSIGGVVPDDSNEIVVKNISFAYPNTEKQVITNLSLQISKGERVAITGKSGCGKTTLLKLITGMITPSKGEISFSGVNLDRIDMEAMHSRIGFVMQDNMLFNTTIRENLLYGKSGASEVEMRDACCKAYILDFIDSLPEGLDTVIGEKGIKLSGGQRQRLVLARLFLRDVTIFIFDEATSALDQYSENIVQDAIRSISKDKTVLVVAHRESSIRLCDRKIVMEQTDSAPECAVLP